MLQADQRLILCQVFNFDLNFFKDTFQIQVLLLNHAVVHFTIGRLERAHTAYFMLENWWKFLMQKGGLQKRKKIQERDSKKENFLQGCFPVWSSTQKSYLLWRQCCYASILLLADEILTWEAGNSLFCLIFYRQTQESWPISMGRTSSGLSLPTLLLIHRVDSSIFFQHMYFFIINR